MTANELRVGNWVLSNTSIGDIPMRVAHISYGMTQVKQIRFKPVPVTEDWMSKLDFKLFANYADSIVAYSCGRVVVEFNDGVIHTVYIMDDNDGRADYTHTIELNNIESIHQLQNLCFAINGVEC